MHDTCRPAHRSSSSKYRSAHLENLLVHRTVAHRSCITIDAPLIKWEANYHNFFLEMVSLFWDFISFAL